MRPWISRRASSMLAALTALALLAPTAAVAEAAETTPGDDPASAAAGWLAAQLVDGERMEVEFDGESFPDQGLTADVVLALAGTGVAGEHIEDATDWLEGQAEAYTGSGGEVYAGPTAKLLLTLVATGRPTTVDGLDLVDRLEGREQDSGRFTDESQFGDFSNTITQSLAVLALHRAEATAPSASAVDYLAAQACDDGGFPQELTDPGAEDGECVSQPDATGFAVQALAAVDEAEAVTDAGAWLAGVQQPDGGFVGSEGTANANSTGLAALALDAAGLDAEADAARAFVRGLQARCGESETGSIRYDADDGGDRARASAQALPALTATSLAHVDASDAEPTAPVVRCPSPFSDLSRDNVHYDAIVELVRREVLLGRDDGTYRPAADLTRAQLASVLARAGDVEPVDEDQFDDIEGSPHAGAINALARAGVVDGYADGSFRPQRPVRRDHAAALIARWLDVDPIEEDRFDDLDTTIHAPLINALADLHVVEGDGEGRFRPDREIRRDQTASLVLRALNVLEDREA